MKNNFPFFIILIFLFSFIEINAQCSMCRAVLQSEEAQETAKGINNGILYLMALPYILVALVGWKVIQILKKE
jgi:Na+/H+ antiporter NhaC